jgi:hypothetical protein
MPKVLIELKNATVMNIAATSDDVTVYVFDHDAVSQAGLGEVRYYLAQASEPVEVDAVVSEDRLMSALEELITEGEVMVEEFTGEADGKEMFEIEDP